MDEEIAEVKEEFEALERGISELESREEKRISPGEIEKVLDIFNEATYGLMGVEFATRKTGETKYREELEEMSSKRLKTIDKLVKLAELRNLELGWNPQTVPSCLRIRTGGEGFYEPIEKIERKERQARTLDLESKELHFLDRIPAACPHCGECCHHKVVDSYINYNRGDSMIDPHVHLNIIYKCYTCDQQFALRAHIYNDKLYYGDLNDGHIEDMGDNTQERLSEGGVLDGFFSEYRGRENIENYLKRGKVWTTGDKKRVWGNLFLDDGYYICVVKTLERSSLLSDADKKTLKKIVEMLGVTRRAIWVAANKMVNDNKPAEEIFSYLKEETTKISW